MANPPGADRARLRVSDADREQAAGLLRQAAGDGRITFAELDERLSLAYAARTYADLDAVTGDLPGQGVTALAQAGTRVPDRIGGTPGPGFSVAFMSGARRAGPWVVPPRYTAVAVMGGVELDLRHARFSEPVVTIQAFTLMGRVSIIVPDDIELDVSGFAFMGGFDHPAAAPAAPGAPVLRVIGFALMGGVDIKRRNARSQQEERQIEGERRDS